MLWRVLAQIGKSFSHLLYPPLCLHCEESLDEHSPLFCQTCMLLLTTIDPQERCPYCFSSDIDVENQFCCQSCREKTQYIHRTAAVFDYEGPAATLVKQMKYGGQPHLAEGAGAFLVAQFLNLNWPMPDCIIPMPMARLRKLERGYNQSQLLAQVVARHLDRPLYDILARKSGDYSQAGLSFDQRLQLGDLAFSIKKRQDLKDKNILLIDDVMTTGSTLRRCAEALLELYPQNIYALTVCRAM